MATVLAVIPQGSQRIIDGIKVEGSGEKTAGKFVQPTLFAVAIIGFIILLLGGILQVISRQSSPPPESLVLIVFGTALLGLAAFCMTAVAKSEANAMLRSRLGRHS